MSDEIRLEATVHGRVHGVGFRWSAREAARTRGLRGWVRNDPGGTVTLCAQGPREAVLAFEEWCHVGPPTARVQKVVVRHEPADPSLEDDFAIRR